MLFRIRGENMFKKIVACMLALTMMLCVQPMAKTEAAIKKSLYKSITQAGVEARRSIYNHKSKVVMRVKSKNKEPQNLFDKIERVIYAETNNVNQGDYMKWDIDEAETSFSAVKSGSYYYYTFTMNMSYLTTLAERKKLDTKVNNLIKGFKFTNKTTTYEKVKKVYDYVCKNVKYAKNTSNDKVYSAYSALINKKAVCQGFASLLYKVYRTMGIPTRVIAGDSTFSGETHGWNIVKIGSYFYNVDATWDSTLVNAKKSYNYFLKGDSFKGHQRWAEYAGSYFYYMYPMAAKRYSAKVAAKACTNTKISKFRYKVPKFKSISRKKAVFKTVKKAKYQLKYSTVNTFKKKYTVAVNASKNTYKFKGLKNGVTYYVKFRACKTIGKVKCYTKWSAIKII